MKTEKIIIGYNDAEFYDHQKNSNLKLENLGEAVQEFKNQTNGDIEDLAEFEAGFYDYLLNYIKEKHKGGSVLGLHDEQFIKLYGYNFDKLKTIEAKYYTQLGSIKIVKNIATVDESLDFNVYAENGREIQKYYDVTELIKAATDIYEKYYIGQIPIQAMQYMNRLYVMNNDGTALIPNKYFIKNE